MCFTRKKHPKYRNTFVRFVVIPENYEFVVNSLKPWVCDSPGRIMVGWRLARSKIFKKSFGGELKAVDVGRDAEPRKNQGVLFSFSLFPCTYLFMLDMCLFICLSKCINVLKCFYYHNHSCKLY